MKVRISIFLSKKDLLKGNIYETLIVDSRENPVFLNRIIASLAPSYITLLEPIEN